MTDNQAPRSHKEVRERLRAFRVEDEMGPTRCFACDKMVHDGGAGTIGCTTLAPFICGECAIKLITEVERLKAKLGRAVRALEDIRFHGTGKEEQNWSIYGEMADAALAELTEPDEEGKG